MGRGLAGTSGRVQGRLIRASRPSLKSPAACGVEPPRRLAEALQRDPEVDPVPRGDLAGQRQPAGGEFLLL